MTNLNQIRPGDTVRVRYTNTQMQMSGVDPFEYTTTVMEAGENLYAGPAKLGELNITILDHTPIPARWAEALAVKTKDGELLGQIDVDYFVRLGGGIGWSSRRLEECRGPITVVIDSSGRLLCDHVFAMNADGAVSMSGPLGATSTRPKKGNGDHQ